MNRKKFLMTVGVIAGVFLGMKYVFPVILPFFFRMDFGGSSPCTGKEDM